MQSTSRESNGPKRHIMNTCCPVCRCSLRVIQGRSIEKKFRLTFPTTMIGRSHDCHVSLADPYVSRIHCKLVFHNAKLELLDCESLSGTRLNGVRVNRALVMPYDIVKVGRTRLMVDCKLNLIGPLIERIRNRYHQ